MFFKLLLKSYTLNHRKIMYKKNLSSPDLLPMQKKNIFLFLLQENERVRMVISNVTIEFKFAIIIGHAGRHLFGGGGGSWGRVAWRGVLGGGV